jgi:hypothetical protein
MGIVEPVSLTAVYEALGRLTGRPRPGNPVPLV